MRNLALLSATLISSVRSFSARPAAARPRRFPQAAASTRRGETKRAVVAGSAEEAVAYPTAAELAAEIYGLAGKEFNIASTQQCARVLFEEMELPPVGGAASVKPDGGTAFSSRGEVLEALRDRGHPIGGLILNWRRTHRREQRGDPELGIHAVAAEAAAASSAERPPRSLGAAAAAAPEDGADGAAALPAETPMVLVDMNHLLYRSYYAMPALHRDDGTPVGALLGVCNALANLALPALAAGGRTLVVLVGDHGGPQWRHAICDEYKANRSPPPEDLLPQFALVTEAAEAFGLPYLRVPGVEADDVIATLCEMAVKEGTPVVVASSDKDLMQLVRDESPGVTLLDLMADRRVRAADVEAKFGVTPAQLGDFLAIAGDSSDNIKGVKGIGAKGAAKLLRQFGTLDALLERSEEVEKPGQRKALQACAGDARKARRLVTLKDDVELPVGLHELHAEPLDAQRLLRFTHGNQLRALTARLREKMEALELAGGVEEAGGEEPPPPATPTPF